MKEQKQWIRFGILLSFFLLSLSLVISNQRSDSIYVSNTEMDVFAAADTLVIRACSGEGTAQEGEVTLNKTGWSNDQILTGTMRNQAEEIITLNAGESYTIPQGYHNGRGQIIVNALADQTNGTATESDITEGQTAWVNGKMITGTMKVQEANDKFLNPGESYNVLSGYYTKNMLITTTPLSQLTPGTVTADSLSAGQIAWVNGRKIVGTGKENQNSYQEGYSETSGKGSTHLSAISTSMRIKQNGAVATPKFTIASMTLDVSGSDISNYIGLTSAPEIEAGNTYQTVTATTDNRQCQ